MPPAGAGGGGGRGRSAAAAIVGAADAQAGAARHLGVAAAAATPRRAAPCGRAGRSARAAPAALIGTGRNSSMVSRETNIASPPSKRSTRRASSAAGAPPCCASGDHGPRASSVGTKRSPSRVKIASDMGTSSSGNHPVREPGVESRGERAPRRRGTACRAPLRCHAARADIVRETTGRVAQGSRSRAASRDPTIRRSCRCARRTFFASHSGMFSISGDFRSAGGFAMQRREQSVVTSCRSVASRSARPARRARRARRSWSRTSTPPRRCASRTRTSRRRIRTTSRCSTGSSTSPPATCRHLRRERRTASSCGAATARRDGHRAGQGHLSRPGELATDSACRSYAGALHFLAQDSERGLGLVAQRRHRGRHRVARSDRIRRPRERAGAPRLALADAALGSAGALTLWSIDAGGSFEPIVARLSDGVPVLLAAARVVAGDPRGVLRLRASRLRHRALAHRWHGSRVPASSPTSNRAWRGRTRTMWPSSATPRSSPLATAAHGDELWRADEAGADTGRRSGAGTRRRVADRADGAGRRGGVRRRASRPARVRALAHGWDVRRHGAHRADRLRRRARTVHTLRRGAVLRLRHGRAAALAHRRHARPGPSWCASSRPRTDTSSRPRSPTRATYLLVLVGNVSRRRVVAQRRHDRGHDVRAALQLDHRPLSAAR